MHFSLLNDCSFYLVAAPMAQEAAGGPGFTRKNQSINQSIYLVAICSVLLNSISNTKKNF